MIFTDKMKIYSDSIEFVALIVRNKYYRMLKECRDEQGLKNNYMTVPKAIRELEKIEMIYINNDSYKLDHAYIKDAKRTRK